eukprot:c30660_g1_i1 orf=1-207(+)
MASIPTLSPTRIRHGALCKHLLMFMDMFMSITSFLIQGMQVHGKFHFILPMLCRKFLIQMPFKTIAHS